MKFTLAGTADHFWDLPFIHCSKKARQMVNAEQKFNMEGRFLFPSARRAHPSRWLFLEKEDDFPKNVNWKIKDRKEMARRETPDQQRTHEINQKDEHHGQRREETV